MAYYRERNFKETALLRSQSQETIVYGLFRLLEVLNGLRVLRLLESLLGKELDLGLDLKREDHLLAFLLILRGPVERGDAWAPQLLDLLLEDILHDLYELPLVQDAVLASNFHLS